MITEADIKNRKRMTAEQEGAVLHSHGTKAIVMTAKMIVQAAEQDMRSLIHNARVDGQRKLSKLPADHENHVNPKDIDEKRKLAFLPAHVRGAKSAAEIIETAIKLLHQAAGSTSIANRHRIYNSPELLKEALVIAQAQATTP